jgi:hypothetical protein
MLQAEVRFEDIGAPVGMTGGGIFFGKSWVLPYAHRLLRTSVIDGPDRLVVGIAERFADDDKVTRCPAGMRGICSIGRY